MIERPPSSNHRNIEFLDQKQSQKKELIWQLRIAQIIHLLFQFCLAFSFSKRSQNLCIQSKKSLLLKPKLFESPKSQDFE